MNERTFVEADRLADQLREIVGPRHVYSGADIELRFVTNFLMAQQSRPNVLVRPNSTEEIAAVVRIAAGSDIPLTVVSGNTGLVGGSWCSEGILISLDRMARVIEIDPIAMTLTVEPGAILETVHEAVAEKGLMFPVDLNSRGSCTIGGMAATNAGGNRVVRYGMMRPSILGLEAVLSDGSVVSRLGGNLKDNAGYDWSQLLIGSEGTLGIITQLVVRLYHKPRSANTALLRIASDHDALAAFRQLEARLGGRLTSFELMWPSYYELACNTLLGQRPFPLPVEDGIYAIAEMLGSEPDADRASFEGALSDMLESGMIADAVLNQSEADRHAIWSLREDGLEVFRDHVPAIALDVSVPVSSVIAFVREAEAMLLARYSEKSAYFFGHAGDGNIHVIIGHSGPDDPVSQAMEADVYSVVSRYSGSIAAEHGIGRKKRGSLAYCRSDAEIALMRRMKDCMDPHGLFNRGAVLPPAGSPAP